MRAIMNDANKTSKTNEEIEFALYHLMDQFRQINSKYGLMVSVQIEKTYDQNKNIISNSKKFVQELDKHN